LAVQSYIKFSLLANFSATYFIKKRMEGKKEEREERVESRE